MLSTSPTSRKPGSRTPRPSPAVVSPALSSCLPTAISSQEIDVACSFLTAHQDTTRITLSALQRRLAPLLFPPHTNAASDGRTDTINTNNKMKRGPPSLKTQEVFFQSLLPRAATAESEGPSLTSSELKELLIISGGGGELHSMSSERGKSALEAAFHYLDHDKKGALNPSLLVSAMEKLEGLSLGEEAEAVLRRSMGVGGDALFALKDFEAVAMLLPGKGEGQEGLEKKDDDEELK